MARRGAVTGSFLRTLAFILNSTGRFEGGQEPTLNTDPVAVMWGAEWGWEFAEIKSSQGQDKLGLSSCGRADRLRLPMLSLGSTSSAISWAPALRWADRPLGPEGNKHPQGQR